MLYTEPMCENYLFRKLYHRGKSYVCPYFVLYAMKNKSGCNRLGITTGKKIGGAVARNRARRLLRETYRLAEPRLAAGYDLVLVARTRLTAAKRTAVAPFFDEGISALGIGR